MEGREDHWAGHLDTTDDSVMADIPLFENYTSDQNDSVQVGPTQTLFSWVGHEQCNIHNHGPEAPPCAVLFQPSFDQETLAGMNNSYGLEQVTITQEISTPHDSGYQTSSSRSIAGRFDEQPKKIVDTSRPSRSLQDSAYQSMSSPHNPVFPVAKKKRRMLWNDSNASKPYQCTRIKHDGTYCLQESTKFADWKRHEEAHWPQRRWECLVHGVKGNVACHICGRHIDLVGHRTISHGECLGRVLRLNHDFHRKDKLIRHLKEYHGYMANVDDWYVSINSDWKRCCGFCGDRFSDWDSRCSHVALHFTAGLRMIPDWKDLWPEDESDDVIFELSEPDDEITTGPTNFFLAPRETNTDQQPTNNSFPSGNTSEIVERTTHGDMKSVDMYDYPQATTSGFSTVRRHGNSTSSDNIVSGSTISSRDSGYFSRASREQRSNTTGSTLHLRSSDGMANEMWESTSIASIQSGLTGGTMSSIDPAAVGGAAEEVVSILAGKDEIRHLIVTGFQIMDLDKFERNFRRLLRDFAKNLRNEANPKDEAQIGAIKLVYTYRAHVTRVIRQQFAGDDVNDQAEAFHDMKNRRVDKIMLERLLAGSGSGVTTQSLQMDEQSDFGSGFSDNEGIPLPNLERVREFLISSEAFKQLERSLALFLDPTRQTVRASAEHEVSGRCDEDQEISCGDIVAYDPEAIARTQSGSAKKRAVVPSNDNLPRKRRRLGASTDSKWDLLTFPLLVTWNGIQEDIDMPDAPGIASSYDFHYDMSTTPKSSNPNVPEAPHALIFSSTTKLQGAPTSTVPTTSARIKMEDLNHSKSMDQTCAVEVQNEIQASSHCPSNVLLPENQACSVPVGSQHHTSGVTTSDVRSLATQTSRFRHKDSFSPLGGIQAIANWLKRIFRPRIEVGKKRIVWKCNCGDELFADLSTHSPTEVARLTSILQCSGPSSGPPPSYAMGSMAGVQTPPPVYLSGRSSSSSSQMTKNSSASTLIGSSSSLNTPSPPPANQAYLELCVNTGKYSKTLGEIDLRGVGCDGELFKRIRSEYSRLQSFKTRIWLMRPAAVHFVKFAVQDPLRVGILQKPLSIPPPQEVDAKNYMYAPCPLQDDPPMPQDIFLHYLSCECLDAAPAWLPRLPKKLDTSILRFTGAINEGWGIHINEGPNWVAIALLNIFMMIMSGVVAFLWKHFKGDFQGAFGFAAWIVMVVDSVLMAYIAKHSQG